MARGRSGTITCAVLAAALMVLALAPAALARRHVPRGFFGVVADRWAVSGQFPVGAQMRAMARNGAESVGLTFNWVHAQPYQTMDAVPAAQRARFVATGPASVPTDFTQTDRLVAAAARAHLQVHPVVIAAPVWARLHRDKEFSPPADPATYASYLTALIARYGPNGSFWAAHPTLHRQPIRSWQVWNEPVGGDGDNTPSVFWADPAPFADRYVALLHAAHDAIKAADPGAEVVLGALVAQSWGTLKIVYDHGGRSGFDAVALHPYTNDAPNVTRILRYVRRVMDRHGDRAKPIQVTEIGWPAFDATGVTKLGYRRASRAQAGWLRAVFRSFEAQRRRLRLELALWYTWIGTDRSRQDAFDHSGLLHLAGGKLHAKPVLGAFRQVAHAAER